MSLIAGLLLLAPAAAAAQPPAANPPQTISGPVKMTASQIRAYNAGLPRDHPNYIRCVSQEVTGSLMMRNKVCRTNQDWAEVQSKGNASARSLVTSLQTGFTSGEPPSGSIGP